MTAPTASLPADEPTEALVRGPALLTGADGTPTAPVPVPPPVRLRIPSLGVDASILALGVEENGPMQLPDDVREVGWYCYGPAPGEEGSAVLAAHVDSRTQGPGVFFRLGTLRPGDVVEVESSSGGVGAVRRAGGLDHRQEPTPRRTDLRPRRRPDPHPCHLWWALLGRAAVLRLHMVVVATPEA